jgi:ligand-binding sensor domain-containing protein/serine phosphatase RsbU (regulator of sigma subunit)
MRLTQKHKALISLGWLFILFASSSYGQTFSFRNYGTERDIPDGYVYNINQSADGFLWIGTSSSIYRFDGFTFFPSQYPDSVTGRYPSRSLKDKNGSLWFGCSDGALFYAKENKLVHVPIQNTKRVSELIEGPDSFIYVIPQGKAIFSVNPSNPAEIHQFALSVEPVLYSAAFTKTGDILIGTEENLLLCSMLKDSIAVIKTFEGFDSQVTSIHKTGDGSVFILGTADNGLFRLKMSERNAEITRFPEHPELNSLNVQAITEDSKGTFWISTSGSGVIRFDLTDSYSRVISEINYNLSTGLPGNDVRQVFEDAEGNFWFGMYGEGISMLTSNSLSYYTPGKTGGENNIIYINAIEKNWLLGTPEGFYLFDPISDKPISFTNLKKQTGGAELKSFCLDNDNNLWLGTGGNGLYVRRKKGSVERFYRSGDSGADDIKDIQLDKQNIWLATTNGVIVLDRSGKLRTTFSINNGLPHNSINKIFLDGKGTAYIGTESERLYEINSAFEISKSKLTMTGSTRNKINSLTSTSDGAIWAATDGNGMFRFLNDSIVSITRANELMSNYCYSILADADDNVWVGHGKAFSRFDYKTGNTHVYGTDYAKVGICNPGAIFETSDKKILIGTTEGLIIYDRMKEKKDILPPFSNINMIEINDVRYPYQKSFVLPYMKYKVKIYYSAISFGSPEKVYYSTFLENFDLDWSKMTTSREQLYSLADGSYKFNLISVNQDGSSQMNPVSFSIFIRKPFYRTWWFIVLAIAFVAFAIVLIIRERDKAQKKIQEYLEKELEARTSVVMKQKGEIELQNIEITDSINYAKRIQTSILPDLSKLKDTFKDAFILFHPRDIVSGDFYWFDRLDDDRFVLVCADSTGHGVPGAFMSMIGSTLLQDIVTRKRISKPSEILTLLDKQIFSTLNQNVELGVSNDGMDMVVCEFNISTRHIRFASAMRPVILVLDGESFYIKGNRSSVGGESVIEKFFDDQEYYLKEGDTVYLFSDGLPDQFGGPDGKKLKIARLKRMIEQISGLPMDTQKEAMNKFYLDWKGTYDQVDDVLLMGVKV